MANLTIGATGESTPLPRVGSTVSTQGYLHPVLQAFVKTLPNPWHTITSHPLYSAFNKSHPKNLAQPTPTPGPNASTPIGNTATPPTTPNFNALTAPPISTQQASQESGVVAGPAAINHVPYGPELTGMDQLGGLITPNGTPVVASEWQRAHLDPTSLSNYEDYASSVAGVNPADLKQQSDLMTGVLNENSPTIKAPIKFDLSNQLPTPSGSGG